MGALFGGFAREARLSRRVQLKTIADALGFSSAYISDIELGYRNPPQQEKLRIWAELIGIEPDRFILMAERDRSFFELPNSGEEAEAELALALARRWTSLSPSHRRKLMKVLDEEQPDEGEGSGVYE